MRGDDGHREQVWNKRGSRFQLPRVPRPSLKTSLKALPFIGIASLSLVGFLAVPAGSPPPPPAVAAEPIATLEPTPTATEIATVPTEPPAPIEQPPPPPVCHPRGIAANGALPSSKAGAVSTIAYDHNSGIWLYDVASNTTRELVRGKTSCGYFMPHFIDRRTVAFYDDGATFHSVDVVTGLVRDLKSHLSGKWPDRWLAAYDITSDGTMAELGSVQPVDGNTSYQLAVSSRTSGKLLFTKRLGVVCACDGRSPLVLQWSDDGSLLVVGVPNQSPTPLIYVFDRTGKQVVAPLKGDTPEWLGGTHNLIYVTVGAKESMWARFDVTTRKALTFLPRGNLDFPAASPDGSKVAFTDASRGRVVVYDFALRTVQTLAGSIAYPLWLDHDRLAVAAVVPCNCEYPAFETKGNIGSIAISTGRTVRLRLTMTWDVDVWY